MSVEIVQGNYLEAKKYCESKTLESIFFDFSYVDSDEKAIFEFNRFLNETDRSDIIGEQATKRIILDLSAWNDEFSYNKYLESFLFMLLDIQKNSEYKFILEKEINKELYKKLNKLKLFKFTLTALSTMTKEKEINRIGFCSSDKGVEKNV